jgi:chemotaxis protein MotB
MNRAGNLRQAYTPPPGKVDPSIDMKTPVRDQVNAMDARAYFKLLASLMKYNPPTPQDAPIVARMAKIGLFPGQDFDLSKLDPAVAQALADVSKGCMIPMPRRGNNEGDYTMSGLKHAQGAMMMFIPLLLLAACVSQQKYDALQSRYDQLNQTMSSEINANQMHIERLQDAIKVTVNGELLFPSGGWQMPVTAQQTIGKMVPILAPMQQTKIVVNGYTDNTPIGPELMREGVTSNLVLSQKRADNVMNFMTSQGVNPALVSAQGFGDADPVASNDTPAGRAQNRRVELTLAGSGN